MSNEILNIANVKATVVPGSIDFNMDELKKSIKTYADTYRVIQYSDDVVTQMKQMKEDRAKLNAIAKSLDDKRKQIKKEFSIPLDNFESEIKEIINLLDEPCKLIDSGVKELEKQRRARKKEDIIAYYRKQAVLLPEDFQDSLLQLIYKDSWENTNTTQKEYKVAIDQAISSYNDGINALTDLDSAFKNEGIAEFKKTLDLGSAINLVNRLQKQQDEILERERLRLHREEEEKMRKKEEAIRAEERRKALEEQQRLEREHEREMEEQRKKFLRLQQDKTNATYSEEIPFYSEATPTASQAERTKTVESDERNVYIRVKDGMVVDVFSDGALNVVILDEDIASEKEIFEFEKATQTMITVF